MLSPTSQVLCHPDADITILALRRWRGVHGVPEGEEGGRAGGGGDESLWRWSEGCHLHPGIVQVLLLLVSFEYLMF